MEKTVLELDLVGYSTIAQTLEQGLDVESSLKLNQQIEGFIAQALKTVDLPAEDTVVQRTGDGAILLFDSPGDAHYFAAAVSEITRQHNFSKKEPIGKRVFRIGISTGDVVVQDRKTGGVDIAGMTIARAVRLESRAGPGEALIDVDTFERLSEKEKGVYGKPEIVAGKRDEKFEAYRAVLNRAGAKDAAFFTEQPFARNLTLFLEMPIEKFDRNALVTDLAKLTKIIEHGVRIIDIKEGSVCVTLQFENAEALDMFIRRHESADEEIKQFYSRWHVTTVLFRDKVVELEGAIAHGDDKFFRKEVLRLFRLIRAHQYDDLVFIMNIPIAERPPDNVDLERKKAHIYTWADRSERTRELYFELRDLVNSSDRTSAA